MPGILCSRRVGRAASSWGKEMEGPLKVEVEGAGEGNMDGSTRRKATVWLEDIRAATLARALERNLDQSARPCWAYPQLDKISQGWILTFPGPEGFTGPEFSETVARYLCLPSPCCLPKVGAPLGQKGLLVDPFGTNVLSVSNIPGDHYRTRHDKVKTVIHSFCLTSGLTAECEVFGMFKDLIPVEALGQEDGLERGRGRQGLLPDFMLELPTPIGIPANTLAELKVIGAVESWYPRNGVLARKKKGVEKRAAVLPGEYRRPLEKLDRRYHGTTANQVGPLVRRLDSFGRLQGLVMGAWQEGSKDLHDLLDTLAESKLNAMGLARGMQGTEMERGTILGQFRRRLSVAAAKAQSACLIGKVSKVGEGHRQAAKRRAWVRREEERMQEERRIYWQASIREKGLARGQLVIP